MKAVLYTLAGIIAVCVLYCVLADREIEQTENRIERLRVERDAYLYTANELMHQTQ